MRRGVETGFGNAGNGRGERAGLPGEGSGPERREATRSSEGGGRKGGPPQREAARSARLSAGNVCEEPTADGGDGYKEPWCGAVEYGCGERAGLPGEGSGPERREAARSSGSAAGEGSGGPGREDSRDSGRAAGRRASEADGRSRRLVLLGSTGSIGRQALEVVRAGRGRFTVEALTAGKNWELLASQAREFMPRVVAVADERYYTPLREALSGLSVEVLAGAEALGAVAAGHYRGGETIRACTAGAGGRRTVGSEGCDRVNTDEKVVLNALVGFAGLAPTVAALRAGLPLALANKESLVAGGEAVTAVASALGTRIIPVDSEHSAVFQCLTGEPSPVRRLIITASGGPFLDTPAGRLRDVTPDRALRHPRWSMGARITIDSATMFNKGFEVMEARWLFGIEPSRIDVLVHPQAAVHSMVEFEDGAVKAQIGTADMRLPICYALTFPERMDFGGGAFDFGRWGDWTFRMPDRNKFPALDIAADCLERGGTAGCTMNAADEVAVAAFLDGRIRFTDIAHTVERTLAAADFTKHPSVGELAEADRQARRIAEGLIR